MEEDPAADDPLALPAGIDGEHAILDPATGDPLVLALWIIGASLLLALVLGTVIALLIRRGRVPKSPPVPTTPEAWANRELDALGIRPAQDAATAEGVAEILRGYLTRAFGIRAETATAYEIAQPKPRGSSPPPPPEARRFADLLHICENTQFSRGSADVDLIEEARKLIQQA